MARAGNQRVSARRAPRGRFKVECRRGTLGLGPNLATSLLDVSEIGARIICREPLAVGQEVELSFMGQGHLRPVKALANVVRCEPAPPAKGGGADKSQPLGGSGFVIALRLQKALTYADFQQLT